MSDKIIQPCNPVIGVAKGQVATLDLQIGPRFHVLWLEITATAAANKTLVLADVLDLISIKINGKPQRAYTATELDQIQTAFGDNFQANGYNYDGGVFTWANGVRQGPQVAKTTMFLIPLFFCKPWRKSYAAADMMAWFTAWQDGSVLRSFQVELTVPNTGNVDAASAITVNAYAETDNVVGPVSNGQPIALINKFKRLAVPYTGMGDLYVLNLEKRQVCNQISFFCPIKNGVYDAISRLQVIKDNAILRDVIRARNDQSLIAREFNEAGLPEARFDVVFDYSDSPLDGLLLEGSKDFRVISTIGVAGATSKLLTFISQIYGGIDLAVTMP